MINITAWSSHFQNSIIFAAYNSLNAFNSEETFMPIPFKSQLRLENVYTVQTNFTDVHSLKYNHLHNVSCSHDLILINNDKTFIPIPSTYIGKRVVFWLTHHLNFNSMGTFLGNYLFSFWCLISIFWKFSY